MRSWFNTSIRAFFRDSPDFWGGFLAGLCSGILLVILVLIPELAKQAIV